MAQESEWPVVTRAQAIASSVTRDDDTKLIEALRREKDAAESKLAEVTTDRDNVLRNWLRVTEALGLPEGHDPDKVIQRIEELA